MSRHGEGKQRDKYRVISEICGMHSQHNNTTTYIKVIVGLHFTAEFDLEPIVPRVPSVLVKDACLTSPGDQTTSFALQLQEIA